MTLSAFPRKSMKLQKYFLIFCPSPNVAPKPTDQSCSNLVSGVPLQISLARFFVFDLPSKLRVVQIRKKIFIFSKMAPIIFINNMTLSAIPGKIPEIIFF